MIVTHNAVSKISTSTHQSIWDSKHFAGTYHFVEIAKWTVLTSHTESRGITASSDLDVLCTIQTVLYLHHQESAASAFASVHLWTPQAYFLSPIMWPPKKGASSIMTSLYSTADPSSMPNHTTSPAWGACIVKSGLAVISILRPFTAPRMAMQFKMN